MVFRTILCTDGHWVRARSRSSRKALPRPCAPRRERNPMRATLPQLTTETLHIRPWPDPVIDAVGHDPRSTYVERFWLGVLGPSTPWLIRRIADGPDDQPAG